MTIGLIIILFFAAIVVLACSIIHYEETHFKITNPNEIGVLTRTNVITKDEVFFPFVKYKKKGNENVEYYSTNERTISFNLMAITLDDNEIILTPTLKYKYNANTILNLLKKYSIYIVKHENYIKNKLSDVIRNNMLKRTKKELFNSTSCKYLSQDCLHQLKNILKENNFDIEILSVEIRPIL